MVKKQVVITRDYRLSISEAARKIGVNRRTVQRWLKAGKVRANKAGKVRLSGVLRQMAKRKVGRPPNGVPSGEHPLYYQVAGTPDWKRACLYFDSQSGLVTMNRMLACLSHAWTVRGEGAALIEALRNATAFAERIVQERKDGDAAWFGRARRFLIKNPEVVLGNVETAP